MARRNDSYHQYLNPPQPVIRVISGTGRSPAIDRVEVLTFAGGEDPPGVDDVGEYWTLTSRPPIRVLDAVGSVAEDGPPDRLDLLVAEGPDQSIFLARSCREGKQWRWKTVRLKPWGKKGQQPPRVRLFLDRDPRRMTVGVCEPGIASDAFVDLQSDTLAEPWTELRTIWGSTQDGWWIRQREDLTTLTCHWPEGVTAPLEADGCLRQCAWDPLLREFYLLLEDGRLQRVGASSGALVCANGVSHFCLTGRLACCLLADGSLEWKPLGALDADKPSRLEGPFCSIAPVGTAALLAVARETGALVKLDLSLTPAEETPLRRADGEAALHELEGGRLWRSREEEDELLRETLDPDLDVWDRLDLGVEGRLVAADTDRQALDARGMLRHYVEAIELARGRGDRAKESLALVAYAHILLAVGLVDEAGRALARAAGLEGAGAVRADALLLDLPAVTAAGPDAPILLDHPGTFDFALDVRLAVANHGRDTWTHPVQVASTGPDPDRGPEFGALGLVDRLAAAGNLPKLVYASLAEGAGGERERVLRPLGHPAAGVCPDGITVQARLVEPPERGWALSLVLVPDAAGVPTAVLREWWRSGQGETLRAWHQGLCRALENLLSSEARQRSGA